MSLVTTERYRTTGARQLAYVGAMHACSVLKSLMTFVDISDGDWYVRKLSWTRYHQTPVRFTHFLDSGEQALTVIVLFNDIEPRAGGTHIAPDGIKHVVQW